MKTNGSSVVVILIVCCLILAACTLPGRTRSGPTATQGLPAPTQEATATPLLPASTQEAAPPQPTPTARVASMPYIVGVEWDPNNHTIHIGIDPWPEPWSNWAVLVDGETIPTREASGQVIVRPDAPLERPPSGVIIGTLPWVTGLDKVDFPCCGTLQFRIPGSGLTNAYPYNLRDAGCASASARVCQAEWSVHEGDWTIQGTESLENQKMLQKGNIYIHSGATLLVKDSELAIERGSTPTIHVYIFVDPGGKLVIDRSKVYPGPDNGGLTCVWNRGQTTLINSPTAIHYLDMGDGASLTIDNSSMIYEIGGLLQVSGGTTQVSNSTLGALALTVPAGAHLTASGLRYGTSLDHWKVQDLIPEASYQLTLDNVKLLKDFVGEYAHGSYERGWIFFLDPTAHVRLSDSRVRKVFLDLQGTTADFKDLSVESPASLTYRDILLDNVAVTGEWGFTLTDANVSFTDSDYLFLQPSGSTNLRLVNSHIVEFIPRSFSGTISFENGSWTDAGEILGGVDYHSASNNFTMKGSLKFGSSIKQNLQWKDARVTREFDVLVTDAGGKPISGATIKVNDQAVTTNQAGAATFSIIFDESNYKRPMPLEAWSGSTLVACQNINFFTDTPIQLHP